MKKTSALIILCFLYTVGLSQDNIQDELSSKLKSSLKMKKTGKYLVGAGAVVTASGIYFYVDGLITLLGNVLDTDDSGAVNEIFAGSVLISAGQALIGTGTALWIVGGTKSNRYQRMLKIAPKEVSLGFSKNGFGLCFKF